MSELSVTFFQSCNKCGIAYPADATYFYKHKSGRYNLGTTCKACHRARCRVYAANHSAEATARHNKWAAANPQRSKEVKQRYEQINKDKLREKCRIKSRKTKYKMKRAEWQRNNRERIRENQRNWIAAHPEQIKAIRANARAIRRKAEGTHTKADIIAIYNRQQGRCYYCDIALNNSYHVDHKIPLCRDGTNLPENLVCACPTCNLRKGRKTDAEFFQFIGKPLP